MISICIPTYEQKGHGANYLTVLLTSITRLNIVEPYEVVIADNATDGKIERVANNFADLLPIKYYFNPVRGASENINFALDHAQGDKIKLMMQDDVFTSEHAITLFSAALDAEGWAITNSQHINASGQRTGQRLARYDHGNFDTNTVGMPSVIGFRKNDLRFDTRLKTFCDLYFYYQLFQLYGPPAVIKTFTVAQRFHPASLSRNQAPSHKQDKNFLIRNGLIPGKAPKIVVAVVVYKRMSNIARWVDCWDKSNTAGAELVIIHNVDEGPVVSYQRDGFTVIRRPNVGFDIGAFQDVCKNRLTGFPDYDYLLWCTDDTLPMTTDFISPFIDAFNDKIGLTCMQISNEYVKHVRTTGFCIRKRDAASLRFPADPITTREHCYYFEHKGNNKTLTRQITARGLGIVQVAPLEKSPLYDSGFWYRNAEALKHAAKNDRMSEHERVFNLHLKNTETYEQKDS